jgi:hypothetical protein
MRLFWCSRRAVGTARARPGGPDWGEDGRVRAVLVALVALVLGVATGCSAVAGSGSVTPTPAAGTPWPGWPGSRSGTGRR